MRLIGCVLLSGLLLAAPATAEIVVPAATAYVEPTPDAARVSSAAGITRWNRPEVRIRWFGQMAQPGKLTAAVTLRLPAGVTSKLRLTVAGESRTAEAKGEGDRDVQVAFGEFQLAEAGYQAFELESLNAEGVDAGNIRALTLAGPATQGAHFNLDPRRNAASVHLAYPVAKETEVSAFYCEMTGVEEPLWTYYMACGWHRGYFGMQVNSSTERRIIFSVWDSGGEAIDRDKVGQENRVTLIAKGEDVYSGDFGNEGTGGHSHLKFPWKTGERQRFLVTAQPVDETFTIYAGYYFRNDLDEWMLISSWKAPKEGGYMRGLYSFSENFIGSNGHLVRKALYGNQWIRTAAGEWIEITTATFSHDPTGKENRRDRFMGLEGNEFFLSHGGFVDGFTTYGKPFTRRPSGRSPASGPLPPLPPAKP